jgi:Protein of unknown function (DUF3617)
MEREEAMMRAILSLGCVLITLSSCSKSEDEVAEKAGASDPIAAQTNSAPMRVKPGLWETKITFTSIKANGLPKAAQSQMLKAMGKGVTVKSCLTKEQTDKPSAEFFGSAKGSNCTIGTMQVSGGTADVAMTCKPDGKTVIESKMTGTFADNSYKMNVHQTTKGTPMGDLVTMGQVEGKWLSECAAETGNSKAP